MRVVFLVFFAAMSTFLSAQAPALIPYQAIARDASGQPLVSATINARFTIHDGTATGAIVWQELQTVSTSALGLFTAQLGGSIPLTGVNWSNGNKFMQVEIDLGNGFIDMGTQQMLSVPYAFFSSDARNAATAQIAGNGISNISSIGDTLRLSNGSYLIVPGISEANVNTFVSGCTNTAACNYNSQATLEDGSCYFVGDPCNDGNGNTIGDTWNPSCLCYGEGLAHTCGVSNIHNPNLTYGSMTDQQGNNYKTIIIGDQEWMAENLNTSIYRNGDPIPTNLNNTEWNLATSGAWAYENNNATLSCPNGKLYNWYACVDSRQLCPLGWHVPLDDEWTQLGAFLGGPPIAGGKMKSMGTIEAGTGLWHSPNASATNSSGFSGTPSYGRSFTGQFNGVTGNAGIWWSFSEIGVGEAWVRYLDFNDGILYRNLLYNNYGLSVRCLRD